MDYSAANSSLWNIITQLGLIAVAILAANLLRSRVAFIRRAMMPVAVMAGFLLLILKYTGLIRIDGTIMEILVYHGIALGFIAMSLRVPNREANRNDNAALKSGAIIVSSYMVQAVTGLAITLLLGYTVMPKLFKAAGLLLPMGYGQGPGQANNVGTSYQNLGFAGGRSFGLAIAAAGYLCACVVGVILLNMLAKKGSVQAAHKDSDDDLSVGFFQDKNELPVSDSIDRLSVQLALVLVTYLLTYLVTKGLTGGIAALSEGLAKTVNTLLWGFNFIVGSAVAVLLRLLLQKGRSAGLIQRQYQNNYLLNRISGWHRLHQHGGSQRPVAALCADGRGGRRRHLVPPEAGVQMGLPGLLLRGPHLHVRHDDRHHLLRHPFAAGDRRKPLHARGQQPGLRQQRGHHPGRAGAGAGESGGQVGRHDGGGRADRSAVSGTAAPAAAAHQLRQEEKELILSSSAFLGRGNFLRFFAVKGKKRFTSRPLWCILILISDEKQTLLIG